MRRENPSADDVEAIWFGHGCELARQIKAFIASWYGTSADADAVVDALQDVLYADVSLLPGLPQLGDPPTLRPAVPPNSHAGRGIATEPGS
jgi:hypothetical protein